MQLGLTPKQPREAGGGCPLPPTGHLCPRLPSGPHLRRKVHASLVSRACNVVSSWFHPADGRGECGSCLQPASRVEGASCPNWAEPDQPSPRWRPPDSHLRPAGGVRQKGTTQVEVRESGCGVAGHVPPLGSEGTGVREEWRGGGREGRASAPSGAQEAAMPRGPVPFVLQPLSHVRLLATP